MMTLGASRVTRCLRRLPSARTTNWPSRAPGAAASLSHTLCPRRCPHPALTRLSRLAGKTQVFGRLPGDSVSDHFRSRLTHTLEVTQIARTIAMRWAEPELAEALALAHDIGHPPLRPRRRKGSRPMPARLWPELRSQPARPAHRHLVRGALRRFSRTDLTLGVREGIIKHSRDYSALPILSWPSTFSISSSPRSSTH